MSNELVFKISVKDLPEGLIFEEGLKDNSNTVTKFIQKCTLTFVEFKEEHIKRKLIELGWTPPVEVP